MKTPQYVIYINKQHLSFDRKTTICGLACDGRPYDTTDDVFPLVVPGNWHAKAEQRLRFCVNCAYRHIETERIERLVLV